MPRTQLRGLLALAPSAAAIPLRARSAASVGAVTNNGLSPVPLAMLRPNNGLSPVPLTSTTH
jgi:hypothetical protein